jgi:hypothetical protein
MGKNKTNKIHHYLLSYLPIYIMLLGAAPRPSIHGKQPPSQVPVPQASEKYGKMLQIYSKNSITSIQ